MARPADFARSATAAALLACVFSAAALGESTMHLSSTGIVAGKIQQAHACRGKGGRDQPLQLSVQDLPPDARYVSIVADDPTR